MAWTITTPIKPCHICTVDKPLWKRSNFQIFENIGQTSNKMQHAPNAITLGQKALLFTSFISMVMLVCVSQVLRSRRSAIRRFCARQQLRGLRSIDNIDDTAVQCKRTRSYVNLICISIPKDPENSRPADQRRGPPNRLAAACAIRQTQTILAF